MQRKILKADRDKAIEATIAEIWSIAVRCDQWDELNIKIVPNKPPDVVAKVRGR